MAAAFVWEGAAAAAAGPHAGAADTADDLPPAETYCRDAERLTRPVAADPILAVCYQYHWGPPEGDEGPLHCNAWMLADKNQRFCAVPGDLASPALSEIAGFVATVGAMMSQLGFRTNSVGSDSNWAHGGLMGAPSAALLHVSRVPQIHLLHWPVCASSADRRSSLRQRNDKNHAVRVVKAS